MCLAIPGEVLEVREEAGSRFAKVAFAGITLEVCLDILPDTAPGEFVLVHVGCAIAKVDREEALRTYRLLEALGQTAELGPDPEEGAP
jgi:hydrogenase expression/formation protein HypC